MAYGAGAPASTGKPTSQRDRLARRKKAMWSERESWDQHIRDVFDQTRPRRTRFSQSSTNKGDRRNQQIIDNTGVIASRVLRSGLVNGLSDPSTDWFKYEPEDLALFEYGPVKDWVSQLQKLVRRIFAESNVYAALPTIYDELGLAATGCAIIDDDFDTVINLTTFTWGEYALACDAKGQVNALYRDLKMTVLQCVERFGRENCSDQVQKQYDTCQYDEWVEVCHAIEPNLERDPNKLDAKNLPYRSVYWEANCAAGQDKDKFLRRSGYRSNPIIAPRWDVVGSDIYGSTCPGMEALGDMRQLQIQHKRLGRAIENNTNPATQGPQSLRDRFVSTLPGQHNVVANPAQGKIEPVFQSNVNVNDLVNHIEDTRRRIKETFYEPYILSISQIEGVQPRNQWEISERKGEGLLVLGPVVQRLQNELFRPLHDRVLDRIYEICVPLWQLGEPAMLPPPPPELQGMPLRIRYVSPLSKIAQQQGVASTERLLSIVAQNAQVFPGMVRKIDEEQVIDELGEMLSINSKIIRSDEVVAQIAEQQAKQQQMEQMAALAKPVADAAGAAKTLSETNVGGGTGALEAMLDQARGEQE